MKPDYKNWVPKGMIAGLGAASAVLTAVAVGTGMLKKVRSPRRFRQFSGQVRLDAVRSQHGAFTPTDSFHTMANGNCQSRSWKVRRTM